MSDEQLDLKSLDVDDVWQVLVELNIDKLFNLSYDEFKLIASLSETMSVDEIVAHLQAYRAYKQIKNKAE